jgi:hypothetical protein
VEEVSEEEDRSAVVPEEDGNKLQMANNKSQITNNYE